MCLSKCHISAFSAIIFFTSSIKVFEICTRGVTKLLEPSNSSILKALKVRWKLNLSRRIVGHRESWGYYFHRCEYFKYL